MLPSYPGTIAPGTSVLLDNTAVHGTGAFKWEPFKTLCDRSTGKYIFALETFSIDTRVIADGILATAAEKLKNSIAAAVIGREAELFSSWQTGLAVPEFYMNPRQFTEMLRMSVSGRRTGFQSWMSRNSCATTRVSSLTVKAGSPRAWRISAECQNCSWPARHCATEA